MGLVDPTSLDQLSKIRRLNVASQLTTPDPPGPFRGTVLRQVCTSVSGTANNAFVWVFCENPDIDDPSDDATCDPAVSVCCLCCTCADIISLNETLSGPTSAPTPSILPQLIESACDGLPENCAAVTQPGTPQNQAILWLANSQDVQFMTETTQMARYGLATLYYSTNGDDWQRNDDWLSDLPLCRWYSTSEFTNICDPMENLLHLELDNNNLNGSLVPELALLPTMQTLSIKSSGTGQLTGLLPPTLAALSQLTSVTITGNSFSRGLPDTYGDWVQVQTLDLSNNNLSGTIPLGFGPFLSANSIDLSDNNLSGPVPASLVISGVSPNDNLFDLNLDDNDFTLIPSQFGLLRNMISLRANRNNLQVFPTAVFSMTQLQVLQLSGNGMDGPLATGLAANVNLKDLFLLDNRLTGPLIPELFTLENLERLNLSFNRLSGPIPSNIGNWVNVRELHLEGNLGINGSIPAALASLTQIRAIHIEKTGLTGSIPDPVCTLYNTTMARPPIAYADCGDHDDGAPCFQWCCTDSTLEDDCTCRFPTGDSRCFSSLGPTGYPPFVTETGQALYDLIVENSANNGAAVDILNTPQHRAYLWSQNIDVRTQSVSDARKLQRFRLMAFYYATNGPTDWTEQGFWASPEQDECNWEFGQVGGELSCNGAGEVTILELVNVGMTGTLVPELSEMTSLRELVLDNTGKPDTGLVGGIPDSLGNLENLNVVKIVGNFFDTPLSDSLFTKWTRLVTLNFSRNQLPGSIPSSVSFLTQVRQFHLGENQLTGPLPSQVQFMTRATLFIVANNQLRSSVPSLLALTELLTLRLDNNNFSGSFPAISTLTQLQANLDLSNNGFSGGIPNSIGNHVNLRSLNLKNSGFDGPLPTGFDKLSKLRNLNLSGNPGLTWTVPGGVCDNLEFATATGSGSAIVDCGVEDTCSPAQNVCCSCCECATYGIDTTTKLFELIAMNSGDNGTAVVYQPGFPQQRAFLWLQNVDTLTRNSLQQRRERRLNQSPKDRSRRRGNPVAESNRLLRSSINTSRC